MIASVAAVVVAMGADFPVREAVTVSVAVMFWLPELSAVAKKFPAPPGRGAFAGRTALASLLVKCTVPA